MAHQHLDIPNIAIEQFKNILDSVGDAVSVQDKDFNVLYQNDSHKNLVGEHVGELCYEAYEKSSHICTGCPLSLAFNDGQVHTALRSAPVDGGVIHVEITASPLKDNVGNIIAGIEIARNVTERMLAEEEIHKQHQFLQNIIESLPYPFYVIDAKTYSLVMANSAAAPRDKWVGKTCYSLTHHRETPCDEKEHPCTLKLAQLDKKPVVLEHIHYDQDGNKRHVEVSGFPIFDENGNLFQLVEFSKDITDQKKIEAEKKELETQFLHAQKMEAIGTLAGGISHDFNNILTSILGYADLVKDKIEEDSETMEDLQQVISAADRARSLVRQILTFSRHTDQEMGPIQINFILKEALKLLRASIPTTIDIHQQINTKEATVLADPTQIHQIVMNLCTNAYKAMPDGGVLEVVLDNEQPSPERIQLQNGLPSESFVCLRVRDTGCGMADKTVSRIFEPYFTTRKKDDGTGLGLSVVHGIVTSLGGIISVESEVDVGTTFSVYLPRIPEQVISAEIKVDNIPTGIEHIFYVDDEYPIASLSKRRLEELGYTVTIRTSSIEALEAFRNHPSRYDLVITDNAMPNMDGITLTKEMLKIRPDLPVVACTGYVNQEFADKARDAGIKKVIVKPVSKVELTASIREILDD